MATIPAYNPQIPYLGLIPGGLHHGSMIRIKGRMNPTAHRFVVNIQCGPRLEPLDDIALHLSVRPPEFVIVRNTYERNMWGSEDRGGGCPIRRGHDYEILILAEHSCYKVAINGTHFCEFRHRIPMIRAKYVHVSGDTVVSYIGQESDPQSNPSIPVVPSAPSAPPYGLLPNYPPAEMPVYAPIAPVPPPPPPPPYSPPEYRPITSSPYPPNPLPYQPSPFPGATSHYPPAPMYPPAPSPYPPAPSPYPVQDTIKMESYSYDSCAPGYGSTQQPYMMHTTYIPEKKNKHTALKIAAAAGGIGLGAYAISRAFHSSSSSSSSD